MSVSLKKMQKEREEKIELSILINTNKKWRISVTKISTRTQGQYNMDLEENISGQMKCVGCVNTTRGDKIVGD